jgi:hypothetical protein
VEIAAMMLDLETPDITGADGLLRLAHGQIQSLGTPTERAYWAVIKSRVLILLADPSGAELHARQAVDLTDAATSASFGDRVECLIALSDALTAQSNPQGVECLHRALTLLEGHSSNLNRWQARMVSGLALRLLVADPSTMPQVLPLILMAARVPDSSATLRKAVAALVDGQGVPLGGLTG